jgi:sarcosine oxidase subunit beta
MMKASRETADAVIVGAGVIGAAVAYELSQRGFNTVSVDKLPAPGYGSTSNSCAIVRAHYSSIEGTALAHDGFSYWEQWPEYLSCDVEGGFARYEQSGTLLLKSPDGHHLKVLRNFAQLGVEHQDLDVSEIAERWPMFDTRSFWPPRRPDDPDFWREADGELEGGIYTPRSGYVNDPQLATQNLRDAAAAKGARFRFNSTVRAIPTRGGRVAGVRLQDGSAIDAPVVVNVAGPHSSLVNRMAGVEDGMRVKTRALRHEVHHVRAPDAVDFERDGIHVSDGDTGIYFRPETGNHILVGSEDPDCDPKVWVDDPDLFERSTTQAQWEAQVYRLARRLRGLGVPNVRRGVVDLYDVSDDWIPIYDRSDVDGFYMAVGTSGNQFKNAAPVGRLMAELIEGCEAGHDHDARSLHVRARFTGQDLDLGFYSRLREINPTSSFSVNG